MKKRFFLQHWPLTMVMITILLANLLMLSFVSVQAFSLVKDDTLPETPIASPTPQETLIIPNTGQGQKAVSIFASLFSSCFFWVTLGMMLLFFLFLFMAKSSRKEGQREL